LRALPAAATCGGCYYYKVIRLRFLRPRTDRESEVSSDWD
jgi:hypothetical protein